MDTLSLIRAIVASPSAPQQAESSPFSVGSAYIFRTVTYHIVGRISAINGSFVTLADAAWIADSGRWSDFLRTSNANEVEPYPYGCIVNLDATTDFAPWPHALPMVQK